MGSTYSRYLLIISSNNGLICMSNITLVSFFWLCGGGGADTNMTVDILTDNPGNCEKVE